MTIVPGWVSGCSDIGRGGEGGVPGPVGSDASRSRSLVKSASKSIAEASALNHKTEAQTASTISLMGIAFLNFSRLVYPHIPIRLHEGHELFTRILNPPPGCDILWRRPGVTDNQGLDNRPRRRLAHAHISLETGAETLEW